MISSLPIDYVSSQVASIVLLVSLGGPFQFMACNNVLLYKIYDYFLTLQLEIDLVWGTPWNIGKILYLSTRYCVFIDSTLLAYCALPLVSGRSLEANA